MIQPRTPKKIKGARKKERDVVMDALIARFPTLFECKTQKEIYDIIAKFRKSGRAEGEFPQFLVEYEHSKEYAKELISGKTVIIVDEQGRKWWGIDYDEDS
jgi:hypothetical protein